MNQRDVYDLTNDFRNNIYVQSFNHNMTVVDFEQWGAGEYKINFNVREKFGAFIHLYIPFATLTTLEKASVFARFAKKHGATVVTTLIGYTAYGRQERETDKEPELFSMVKTMIDLLPNPVLIDPHNIPSTDRYDKRTWFAVQVDKTMPADTIVIAPDAGARQRNTMLGIGTHIDIDKSREGGAVTSEIRKDNTWRCYGRYDTDMRKLSLDERREQIVNEPIEFIIYDDICDGGRTFVNVADLVKAKYPKCTITLCVAHAILPFGTAHLKGKIDKIITLNTCFPAGTYDNGFLEVRNAIDVFYN